MQIENNQTLAVNSSTAIRSKADADTKTSSSSQHQVVNISEQGKAFQQMDNLSQQMDQLLAKNLSPEQKQNLSDIYTQLDKLHSQSNGSEQASKKEEALLEQAHNILESGYDKLSKPDQQRVDKLNLQLENVTSKLEAKYGAEFSQEPTTEGKKSKSKSGLTAAELNALPASELKKLPINLLKKLNAQNLNKLSTPQLNLLDLPQLKQLNQANIAKLDPAQAKKLEA